MTASAKDEMHSFDYADARSESWAWWTAAAFFLLMAAGGIYQSATGDRPLERWGLIGPPDQPILPIVVFAGSLVCGGIGALCVREGIKSARLPRLRIQLTQEGVRAPREDDASRTEFVQYKEVEKLVYVSHEQAGLVGMRLVTGKGPLLIMRRKLDAADFETIEGILLTRTAGALPENEVQDDIPPPPPERGQGVAAPRVFVNWGFWIVLGAFPAAWLLFCGVVLMAAWSNGRLSAFWDWPTMLGLIALPVLFVATCWFFVPNRRWHRLELWPRGMRITYLTPRYRVRWIPYQDIRKLQIVTQTVQTGDVSREAKILFAYLRDDAVIELAAGERAHAFEQAIRQAMAARQVSLKTERLLPNATGLEQPEAPS